MKIFVLILSLLLTLKASRNFYEIPKTLWTFWDTGFDSAKLFTKMCINNMKYYSNISGWQFRFLSNENYSQYISKQSLQRLDIMYRSSQHKISKQNWADLMRLFLIYQNGGMWIDTNSFFLGNFSWLDNISKEKWVINKLTAQPEVITFSLSSVMGGNTTAVYNQELKDYVHLFPGIQIWSFISKPKSKFLTDVIDRLQYSLKTQRKVLDEETERQNILFGREKDPYYITSNYVFQTVLQKKQHQLDQNTLLNNSKYAVEYYSMWTIPAEDTVYGIFSAHNWFTFSIIGTLFKEGIEAYVNKYHVPAYFIKFNGGNYPHANNALMHHEFINCLGVDVSIQNGSVFDEFMMKRNNDLEEIKHINKMYQLGYMDNHECHHIDQTIFAYLNEIKLKIFFILFIIIAFHAILFYAIKRVITKKHQN